MARRFKPKSQDILDALATLPHHLSVVDESGQRIWDNDDVDPKSSDRLRPQIILGAMLGDSIRDLDPTSRDYFSLAAAGLAQESGFDFAYVSRFIEDGARYEIVGAANDAKSLGVTVNTEIAPCRKVVETKRYFHVNGNLARMFPRDAALEAMNIRTYAGDVYLGPSGIPLGHVFILSTRDVPDSARLRRLLWVTTTAVSQALVTDALRHQLHDARQARRKDALTGLLNQAAFLDDIRGGANRYDDGNLALLAYLDLDGMKAINDTQGHLAGDRLLMLVADSLRQKLRPVDGIYRLGGDEFAVVWSGANQNKVPKFLERLRTAIDQVRGQGFPDISLSIGIAGRTETSTVERWIQLADQRMYKDKGRLPGRDNDEKSAGE